MRIGLLAFAALMLCAVAKVQAQEQVVPPEIVRLENLQVENDIRTVYVGNANKHYVLTCDVKAEGCITPKPNKDYWLVDSHTRWKLPGATNFLTLAVIQDWTVKYNAGENIGLVSKDGSDRLGIFLLDTTGGGYERDTAMTDGPIIYGTGMNEEDRNRAWKHFFLMMVEAVGKQQGKDVLGVKLARRCISNDPFCLTTLDAMLVGVGGIQEPRKVAVIVVTDPKDQNKQLERMVCTWPAPGHQVCRDWDTGKLVTGYTPAEN